jgi:beta-glucosidase
MHLPGYLDKLISAVAAANSNTVLILQSGTPVTMPWLDAVPGVIQAWYGGNETGNAIADIIFGDANPSGKLPLSFPVRNEDNPAFLSFRSEQGRTVYTDDIFVGYRHYEKVGKKVNFPFGYGLSYTTFETSNLKVTKSNDDLDAIVTVSVDVKNTGHRTGAEVVQVYVAAPAGSAVSRPLRELKGYKKVLLQAGESKSVEIPMAVKYAGSYWDEERDMWALEKGVYVVEVGGAREGFEVESRKYWRGL